MNLFFMIPPYLEILDSIYIPRDSRSQHQQKIELKGKSAALFVIKRDLLWRVLAYSYLIVTW